jgi:hypothetical protein
MRLSVAFGAQGDQVLFHILASPSQQFSESFLRYVQDGTQPFHTGPSVT